MRRAAEVSSFNLMYTLCMYYEKQKSYDKTELTFQPTLVYMRKLNAEQNLEHSSKIALRISNIFAEKLKKI